MSFLDKFVYKNPRQKERLAGGSIMQPLRARKVIQPRNSDAFIDQPAHQVPAEDKFFHHYFNSKPRKVKKPEPKDEHFVYSDDDDEDSEQGQQVNLGDIEDDDGAPEEFDYDQMDNLDSDEDNEYINEPTEAELESMLLGDDEFMDEVDDFEETGGESSAFAAAEEYAQLLDANDDVNEKTLDFYREKANLKVKRKPSNRGGNQKSKGKQTTGKRNTPSKQQKTPLKKRKKH